MPLAIIWLCPIHIWPVDRFCGKFSFLLWLLFIILTIANRLFFLNWIHDSKIMVMIAITAMPAMSAINCLIDSFESFSFIKSGNTVTNEMWRKPPAVNGIIHDVRASIAFVTFVPPMATNAPIKPVPAVNIWALAASQRLKPDRNNIAKSPTSCGISCTIWEQKGKKKRNQKYLFDQIKVKLFHLNELT